MSRTCKENSRPRPARPVAPDSRRVTDCGTLALPEAGRSETRGRGGMIFCFGRALLQNPCREGFTSGIHPPLPRRRHRTRRHGNHTHPKERSSLERGLSGSARHCPRTMYGWLPRDKGLGDLRQLVGCGHVFGVSIAVGPRALMNVRLRLGSLSMARAPGAPVRTGCPCLLSVSLPSSHFALAISIRPRTARNSSPSRCPPGLARSQHRPDLTRHAVGQRDGHDLQRLLPQHASQPVFARIGPLAG